MKLQNPFTKGYIEYPISFAPEKLHYQIHHDTPFTKCHSEWAVSILETGDMIYIPCGQNRCRNIYIVTHFYIEKIVEFPRGIYTMPLSFFTRKQEEIEYYEKTY